MCMQVESTGVWETPRKMFKVVREDNTIGPFSLTKIPAVGIWIKAGQEPVFKSLISYKPGFHVFETKKDATEYSEIMKFNDDTEIKSVLVRGEYTKGYIANFVDLIPCFAVAELQIPIEAVQE